MRRRGRIDPGSGGGVFTGHSAESRFARDTRAAFSGSTALACCAAGFFAAGALDPFFGCAAGRDAFCAAEADAAEPANAAPTATSTVATIGRRRAGVATGTTDGGTA